MKGPIRTSTPSEHAEGLFFLRDNVEGDTVEDRANLAADLHFALRLATASDHLRRSRDVADAARDCIARNQRFLGASHCLWCGDLGPEICEFCTDLEELQASRLASRDEIGATS